VWSQAGQHEKNTNSGWSNSGPLFVEKRLQPDRIFNSDESGLDRRYGKRATVVVEKANKPTMTAERNTIKTHVTVVATICADGTYLPPMWLLQGKTELKDSISSAMLKGTLPGSAVITTDNGWINGETWGQFLQFFIGHLGARPPTLEDPVLLIVDGHRTRLNNESLSYARAHHVHLMLLPPNMTSHMQPLDVGVFGPFKVRPTGHFSVAVAVMRIVDFRDSLIRELWCCMCLFGWFGGAVGNG